MARVATSCIGEAVWLWRSNRYVRLLRFLRISGPYTHHHHHHHHKSHQTLSTSWRPLIKSLLFPGQKFNNCTQTSLYQHSSVWLLTLPVVSKCTVRCNNEKPAFSMSQCYYLFFNNSQNKQWLFRSMVFTHRYLGAFTKWRKANISFVMSVRPHETNRLPLEGFFKKFDIWVFFENVSRTLKFHWNLTRIRRTLHEDQYTFLIISLAILPITRYISDTICR